MATTIPTFSVTPNRNSGAATFAADMDTWIGEISDFINATNTAAGEIEDSWTDINAWYPQVQTWHTDVSGWYTQVNTWQAQVSTNTSQVSTDAAQVATDRTAVATDRTAVEAAIEAITGLGDNDHLHTISGVTGLQSALDDKADAAATTAALDAQSAALAAALTHTLVSSAHTATAGQQIAADVSGGAFTVTLPASPTAGDTVTVSVIDGDVTANNLTIAGDGATVQGDATLVIDVALARTILVYNGTEWRIA